MARYRFRGGKLVEGDASAAQTLEEMFRQYMSIAGQGVDVRPDSVQYVEMRRSFYAGAFSLLTEMAGPVGKLPDAEGVKQVKAWWEECAAFYRAVEKNEA